MREVHSEGLRERHNMRTASVKHQLEPKEVDGRGKIHWCCPRHMSESKDEGVLAEWLDENGYEFDSDAKRYVEIDG